METSLSTLAERLVLARREVGVGQDVIAQAARMSQQSYSDLETGKSKATTKIGSLARALGVDAYWLETGEGEMRPTGTSEHPAAYASPEKRKAVDLILGMPADRVSAFIRLIAG